MRGLALRHAAAGSSRGDLLAELGLDARSLQRFTLLAAFLNRWYPHALQPRRHPFAARPSAVHELSRLHRIAQPEADEIADRCFDGSLKMIEIRALVERAATSSLSADPSDQYRKKDLVDFENQVVELFRAHPEVLGRIGVTSVERVRVRNALMPDLVARCDHRSVALELKAPPVRPIRTWTMLAADLMARIAVLRQHFDDVVVVMPLHAEPLARETLVQMREWIRDSRPSVCSVPILLTDGATVTWVGPVGRQALA